MSDKCLPDDGDVAAWLAERATGHSSGYDIAIYAKPHRWLAVADELRTLRAALDRAEAEKVEAKYWWDKIRADNDALRTELAAMREALESAPKPTPERDWVLKYVEWHSKVRSTALQSHRRTEESK